MTTNTNYSFSYRTNEPAPKETTTKTAPARPGQYGFYGDLCKQRNITPDPITKFNADTISAAIDKMLKSTPASEKQVAKILEKIEDLKNVLVQMEFTEEQLASFEASESDLVQIIISGILKDNLDMDSVLIGLVGGMDGTASKLIQGLIDTQRLFSNQMPPSSPQIEMMVNMFLYPDASFEDYGVERRIELESGLWRKPTPQEFAENIEANMTKAEASAFIDKNRGGFYDWRNTRIQPTQASYIRELESRMGNDSKLSVVETATTIEGETVEVPAGKNESIKGSCYTPFDEYQLMMLSKEQASAHIDMLKAELSAAKETSLEGTAEDDSKLRNILDVDKLIKIEYEAFTDLMFSLEAVAGYANDELHEAATYNLVADDDVETSEANREVVKEFMKELVANGSISFQGLMELCSASVTAQRIVLGI